MEWKTIEKARTGWTVVPNLTSYEQTQTTFSWTAARSRLDGLPTGQGLNIAHEAIDRHALGTRRNHLALRWIGKRNEVQDFTYADLLTQTNRFANVLQHLGVGKGDRVFLLAGRIPELYISALGALKNGSVFCPLFSAFGPEPIRQRLSIGEGRVLVTTTALYKRKVAEIRSSLPHLQHVLLIGAPEEIAALPGVLDFHRLMAETNDRFTIAPTDPEDLALLHFTSGTTGKPKGAMHVHQAVIAHHTTGYFALDFHPDDIFWCTADPGWVTGTSYGIIAPLTHGITSIVDEADFDAERWYRLLQQQGVTVWYTAPTAVRMMMKVGTEVIRKYDLSRLRFIASVGEPLNPEAVVWGQEAFGLPIHDNWWQTETGGIMIANYPAMDIRPGSMGRPLPGITAGIVQRQQDGVLKEVSAPDVEGELALRPGWPSMFRGYLHEERYRKCFADGLYLTGDLAKRDADGYFWFVGRADDVIKSSGHLIGPFEVESALMEHAAVAEVGVIGKPDPVAGEVVKAFVSLKTTYVATEELRRELLGFARKRLGAVVAPKEIDFVANVPKTRSGKIMRRLLKARELGLPEGDTSTLEGEAWCPTNAQPPLEQHHSLFLLREMLRIRRFEEKCAELYSAAKIRGFLHLYIGEEAIAVGVMQTLEPDDAIIATYREHGHALARGVAATSIMAEMYGKQEGCSRGRGGSMHLFDAATRFYGGNAIVGGGLPLAVGLALADKMQGHQRVTACFFGEGAVAEGEFHESMNLAALWKLPVLFCCENNLYAMGTAVGRSESETDLCLKASSYEIPAWPVDGMDVIACEEATQRAVLAVRSGGGPYFLEFRTYRFRAHSMFDPQLYRDKQEIEAWKHRDPVATFQERMQAQGLLSEEDLKQIEDNIAVEITKAVEFAEAGTWEPIEQLTRYVYSEKITP